jgi:hypothetical protein
VKVSQWIAAVGIAAGVLVAAGGAAVAAPGTDAAACADGAITIVTDENGTQHEACVAVAAETPPVSALPTQSAPAQHVPVTSTTTAHATLPVTGVGNGALVIAAVLVGSGSLVSLLSRRKPMGSRKGFRGRRATP